MATLVGGEDSTHSTLNKAMALLGDQRALRFAWHTLRSAVVGAG